MDRGRNGDRHHACSLPTAARLRPVDAPQPTGGEGDAGWGVRIGAAGGGQCSSKNSPSGGSSAGSPGRVVPLRGRPPPASCMRRSTRPRCWRRGADRATTLNGPGDRPGRSVVLWQSDRMAHDHHQSAAAPRRGRGRAVFAITVAVLVVEVAGAALSDSLALLADAGHVLADGAGIGLALLAIRFAARPATPQRTFGYYRLEILAAVVNAVLLFGVAGFVLIEAWRRLTEPPEVASGLMLAVAAVGLVANAVSMWLLRGGQQQSLNLRGAYLEGWGGPPGPGG